MFCCPLLGDFDPATTGGFSSGHPGTGSAHRVKLKGLFLKTEV